MLYVHINTYRYTHTYYIDIYFGINYLRFFRIVQSEVSI